MTVMTLTDLHEILTVVGGEDLDLTGAEFASASLVELGYDSLALLETAVRIKREYGVEVDDTVLGDIATPQDLLDHVNSVAQAA